MKEINIVDQYNRMHGRLRVSVTHQCQLRCHFCHREGIAEHWVNRSMPVRDLEKLARAYAAIGGRYLEITGGEPTLHSEIDILLRSGRAAGCEVILCTNGLRLDRALRAAEAGCVQLVKLSLHHDGSDRAGAKQLLGKAWSYERVDRNLEALLKVGTRVQLIFTHTGANETQLESVLRRALEWRVEVQIVDLIASRVSDPSGELGYRSGNQAEEIVSRHAQLEQVVADRTGAILRRYRTAGGASWEVKDAHFGVLHSGMCAGCPLRDQCGEGVYALRVDSLGILKPCLLRSDLEETIMFSSASLETIADVLQRTIMTMLSQPIEWSYGNASAALEFP
jgi:cyclic pyranopterin phosphate synthase